VIRSERLFVFGDSWFSTKAIKVVCFFVINEVKLSIYLGGRISFEISKTKNAFILKKSKQICDAKAVYQKGNNPDYKLRSSNKHLVLRTNFLL